MRTDQRRALADAFAAGGRIIDFLKDRRDYVIGRGP
jgi:hypothetical protein